MRRSARRIGEKSIDVCVSLQLTYDQWVWWNTSKHGRASHWSFDEMAVALDACSSRVDHQGIQWRAASCPYCWCNHRNRGYLWLLNWPWTSFLRVLNEIEGVRKSSKSREPVRNRHRTCFGDFNLDSFVELLMVTAKRVLVFLDWGGEQGIYKCGFSQAGFTY